MTVVDSVKHAVGLDESGPKIRMLSDTRKEHDPRKRGGDTGFRMRWWKGARPRARWRHPEADDCAEATREEMSAERVPLQYRDSCAHLLIPLNKCRFQSYYLPWKCQVFLYPLPDAST